MVKKLWFITFALMILLVICHWKKVRILKHFKKQYLATPLKRQVDVEQICNAVDFFIKNRSVTGQVLAIDSGQNLNWQTPDIMGGKE